MAEVSVDNNPVSIVLLSGEEFTVPSDEILRVTIVANSFGTNTTLLINGGAVVDTPGTTTQPIELVLAPSDTLEADTQHNLHISGFDIA